MKTLFVTVLVLSGLYGQAQLGIGTYSPHASAQLEVSSPDRGVLLPRLTQAQRLAISNPAAGLLIFQEEVPAGFYYYTGSEWTNIIDYVPATVPSGTVTAFSGTTAPAGWALCDGAAISRVTNTNLFSAIGTSFGAGNGTTTFNVPDLRGRAAFGKDNMGGTSADVLTPANGINGATLGASGGSQSVALTTSNMASHKHSFTGTQVNSASSSHSHTYYDAYFAEKMSSAGTGNNGRFGAKDNVDNDNSFYFRTPGNGHTTSPSAIPTTAYIHTHTVTPAGTLANKGSGTAVSVVNPAVVVNYIIKL